MKKENKALVINILIFIFELLGLIITINNSHTFSFEYYTNDSNLLMLISSGLFIFYSITYKSIPKWLKTLKYISVAALTITILTVLFILGPMMNFDYGFLLFTGQMFIYHLLCPILAIISFVLYEDYKSKDVMPAMIYTLVYALVLIILNILNIVDGPYPFLKVNSQPVITSIIWFGVLFAFNYAISYYIIKFNKKFNLINS